MEYINSMDRVIPINTVFREITARVPWAELEGVQSIRHRCHDMKPIELDIANAVKNVFVQNPEDSFTSADLHKMIGCDWETRRRIGMVADNLARKNVLNKCGYSSDRLAIYSLNRFIGVSADPFNYIVQCTVSDTDLAYIMYKLHSIGAIVSIKIDMRETVHKYFVQRAGAELTSEDIAKKFDKSEGVSVRDVGIAIRSLVKDGILQQWDVLDDGIPRKTFKLLK